MKPVVLLAFSMIFLAGCASGSKTTPAEFFVLSETSAANKAMETREFETSDSDALLSASAAALQDLGFQVTETDRDLGFLRAAKERSAREYGQEILRSFIAFLSVFGSQNGQNTTQLIPVTLQQQINASLISRPLPDSADGQARNQLRIVFYRLIWKGDGQNGNTYIPPGEQKMEMIRDPLLYQSFFARLSKAVFLEAQNI